MSTVTQARANGVATGEVMDDTLETVQERAYEEILEHSQFMMDVSIGMNLLEGMRYFRVKYDVVGYEALRAWVNEMISKESKIHG